VVIWIELVIQESSPAFGDHGLVRFEREFKNGHVVPTMRLCIWRLLSDELLRDLETRYCTTGGFAGRLWRSRAPHGVLDFLGKDFTVKMSSIGAVIVSLLIAGLRSRPALAKDEPKWVEVHSTHFTVLTDAGEKRGGKCSANGADARGFRPTDPERQVEDVGADTIVALKSDKQYGLVAPAKQSTAGLGFMCQARIGSTSCSISLRPIRGERWRIRLAHLLLELQLSPRAGMVRRRLAEYFGSIYIGKQVELAAIRSCWRSGTRTRSMIWECGAIRRYRSR